MMLSARVHFSVRIIRKKHSPAAKTLAQAHQKLYEKNHTAEIVVDLINGPEYEQKIEVSH